MAEVKDFEQVNTPMNARQLEALEYIKTHEEIRTNADAVRKAVINLARLLGWDDPNNQTKPRPAPTSLRPIGVVTAQPTAPQKRK
jgi:hypothetical protein